MDHLRERIYGAFLGGLMGGTLGLGTCVIIIDEPIFFPGDTMLFGAILCGTLGFIYGEPFLEFLKELWWWLP